MNDAQTIAVRTEFDVFVARMQVRKLAQAIGFDITSQARIALATSSVARVLRLGEVYQGEVHIDRVGEAGRRGVRVTCTAINGADNALSPRTFTDTRWLIDDLTVGRMPSNAVKVTVVKWM